MQTRLYKELTGKTQSLSSTDTVPQSNTKSQDVLKMAATVNCSFTIDVRPKV